MKRLGAQMKKQIGLILATTGLLVGCGPEKTTQVAEPQLETALERASYAMGMHASENMKKTAGVLDNEAFLVGVRDQLSGKKSRLTQAEIDQALEQHHQEKETYLAVVAEKTLQEGQDFLAATLKRPEINKVAGSDVLFEVLTQGTGNKPTRHNRVKAHYHGSFIDGTVFDSSVVRGEPISFNVKYLIKGWQDALVQMPVGSKWRLYIPSHLAYGSDGTKLIPANSALIFEVELLEIMR